MGVLNIPIISFITSCERNFIVVCVVLKLMNFTVTELVYKHRYLNSVSLKIFKIIISKKYNFQKINIVITQH